MAEAPQLSAGRSLNHPLEWRLLPTILLRALGVTVFGFLFLVMLALLAIPCVFASLALASVVFRD